MNPVLARELKERFRGRWSPVFFTLWIAIIVSIGYFAYVVGSAYVSSTSGFFFGGASVLATATLGRLMFEVTSIVILSAVLFVVPGIAALAIVGERDRLTLPLLQISQLRPHQIVLGKLGSSLAYVILLVVAVAPILTVPMLIGGVTFSDVLMAFGVILATAVVLGSLALWSSARARTIRGAVAASYLWSFLIAMATLMLLVAEVFLLRPGPLDTWGPDGRELYSAWANPYIALVSAVNEPVAERAGVVAPTPFVVVDELLILRQHGTQGADFGLVAGEPGILLAEEIGGPGVVGEGVEPNRGPIWHRTLLLYAALSAVALIAAARKVTAPKPRRTARRRRITPRRISPKGAEGADDAPA